MARDERRAYWDEAYLHYWRGRTDEMRAETSRANRPPERAIYDKQIDRLGLCAGDRVLEVGIGLGRTVPGLIARGARVTGIDISRPMVREARRTCAVNVAQSIAEALPFRDGCFDAVVCWAVFDALYQERALVEMARVLCRGGHLLVSGKNDDYHEDDHEAFVAERGARHKGHPNYFTDHDRLGRALEDLGLEGRSTLFYERRGDLSLDRCAPTRPRHFYEYALVAKKTRDPSGAPLVPISAPLSRTFARLEATECLT